MPTSEWDTTTLEAISHIEMGQSPGSALVSDSEGSGVPFLQGNAEFSTIYPSPRLWCSKPPKTCKSGDALISVRAPVGAINRADRDYCIGRGLAAIRFTGADRDFGYHALGHFSKALRRVAQGTTFEAVAGADLRSLLFPQCSLSEQRRIATILDTLDDAIRRTEQVIAKLQQMKQGLLHDLLTRGVDEHGELRDPVRNPELFADGSLGVLPRGWQFGGFSMFPCSDRELIKTGPFGTAMKGRKWADAGVPVITIGALGERELIRENLLYLTASDAERFSPYRLRRGDLVFSRVADVGRSLVIQDAEAGSIMSSNLMRISLDPARILPNYAHLAIVHGDNSRRQIRRLANSGARAVVNTAILAALRFAWPPRDEQDRICAIAEVHDEVVAAELQGLGKLRLLKHGLLHDLLTGRVRVSVPTEVTA